MWGLLGFNGRVGVIELEGECGSRREMGCCLLFGLLVLLLKKEITRGFEVGFRDGKGRGG